MEGAAWRFGAGEADAVRGAGSARRARCRRARRPQFRGRARRAGRQCVRGGHPARAGAASVRQAGGGRALERGRARAHEPCARRPRTAQFDARRLVAACLEPAQAGGGAGRARHRIRFRDGGRGHRQRAGHSRRSFSAAAPRHAPRRQFHRRGHQPGTRRSGGARRSRHRALCRPAGDHGDGRAARLPGNSLRRRRQALFAGGERRPAVALRRRASKRRSRPARQRQLAGAQGAHEEPHSRDRRRIDQGGGRAADARGAALQRGAGRL